MISYEYYLQIKHLSYDTNYHAIMLKYCGPYILNEYKVIQTEKKG